MKNIIFRQTHVRMGLKPALAGPTPLPTIEKKHKMVYYNGRIVFEILKKFKYMLLEKYPLGNTVLFQRK